MVSSAKINNRDYLHHMDTCINLEKLEFLPEFFQAQYHCLLYYIAATA